MPVSEREFNKLKQELSDTQDTLKKVTSILFSTADDTRFKAKTRKQVIDGVTASGLPIIIDDKGTRWSITNVTKLN